MTKAKVVAKRLVDESEKIDEDEFRPYRCATCGRYLLGEAILEGRVAIKCHGCKSLNVLEVLPQSDAGAIIEGEQG